MAVNRTMEQNIIGALCINNNNKKKIIITIITLKKHNHSFSKI